MLPLAWRIRVEDTPANRAELRECWAALKKTWTWAGTPTCTMSPYGELCGSCTNNQCYGNGERSVCQVRHTERKRVFHSIKLSANSPD